MSQPSLVSNTAVTVIGVGGIPAIAWAAFHYAWRPMLAPYPPVEPHPDAVRRSFQSFSIGYVNMGLSIHVAADEDYLHLTPLSVWRLLGAEAASIPWSALKKTGRRTAMLGPHRIIAPHWCIDLIQHD